MIKKSVYITCLLFLISGASIAYGDNSVNVSGQYPSPGTARYENLSVTDDVSVSNLQINSALTVSGEFVINPVAATGNCQTSTTGMIMVTDDGRLAICDGTSAEVAGFWEEDLSHSTLKAMKLKASYFADHGVKLRNADYATWMAPQKIIFSPSSVGDLSSVSNPDLAALMGFGYVKRDGSTIEKLNFYSQLKRSDLPIGTQLDSDDPAMTIMDNGNMGIGIEDPEELLHVYGGELRVQRGDLDVGDDLRIGHQAEAMFFVQNTSTPKMAGFLMNNNDVGMQIDSNRDIVFQPYYVALDGKVKYKYNTMPTSSNVVTFPEGFDSSDVTGDVLMSDRAGVATWQPYPNAPIGAISAFALAACPDGWSAVSNSPARLLLGADAAHPWGSTAGEITHNHGFDVPANGWGYQEDHNVTGWLNTTGSNGTSRSDDHGATSNNRAISSEPASLLPPVTALTYCQKISEDSAPSVVGTAPPGPDGEDGKNWVDEVCTKTRVPELCVAVRDMFCLMNPGVDGCPSGGGIAAGKWTLTSGNLAAAGQVCSANMLAGTEDCFNLGQNTLCQVGAGMSRRYTCQ